MLVRLDSIPGVAEARADSSGRFFRVELSAGAAPAEIAESIRAVLGAAARQLGETESRAQLAARPLGDPWLRASEVMALSFVEGRIVAVRVAAAAAAQVPALAAHRDRLAEALRVELFATFERVHREGGRPSSGWIHEAWPRIAQTALTPCAASLPPGVAADLAACPPSLLD